MSRTPTDIERLRDGKATNLSSGDRIATRFGLAVSCVVLAVLVLATINRDLHILLTSQNRPAYPATIYSILPVPGISPSGSIRAVAGADFSQVYFAALALRHGESAYRPDTPTFRDPFGRLSGYPPLTNWLYVPITLLPYQSALLVHTIMTLVGLFAVTFVLLWKTGLLRHGWHVFLAMSSLYLLTPVGLTHFERGQFDLLVATAALLCLSCVFLESDRWALALGAGLLGTLKWTAVPFLFCYSAWGFTLDTKPRRWAFLAIPAVVILGTFAFWSGLREYWPTIRMFEIDAQPYGLTLQHFLPRWPAKLVPLALTGAMVSLVLFAGATDATRTRLFRAVSLPFALALLNVTVCFGTLSYEYHTVSTLGMIPAMVVWTVTEAGVSDRVKALTCGCFGGFLCVAFRVLAPLKRFDPVMMTSAYLFSALVFFGICVYVAVVNSDRTSPSHGD